MLLASERSERDTYRGNTIENRGCLFIYSPLPERPRLSLRTINRIQSGMLVRKYISGEKSDIVLSNHNYGGRQIKAKWNNEEFGYFNTITKIANAKIIRFVFRFINRIQTSILVYNCNLLASEHSERDTYMGKNEKIWDVYLFIYMDVCMSFCTLTLRIFMFAPRSTPSQTSLNRIIRFSDHYPYHLRN